MMQPGSYMGQALEFEAPAIVKPNIRTGEGRRTKFRIGAIKQSDQKKKAHRKMAKKSRRANRR